VVWEQSLTEWGMTKESSEMNLTKGSILMPGFVILATAVLAWYAPAARADQLVPRRPQASPLTGLPVGLVGGGQAAADPGFRAPDEQPRRKAALGSPVDWESYLREAMEAGGGNLQELFEKARVLSMSMIAIGYTLPTTTTTPPPVVSSDVKTWQWKSSGWSMPQCCLPPPPGPPPPGTPVTTVPEPASMLSGLIGLGLTGAYVWRRRVRKVA
jgi:hypothetical protein